LAERREALVAKHKSSSGFVPTSANLGVTSASASSDPEIEILAEPESDNPSHKEDFRRLLGAAAKGNKPAS
jgi:hypothetical protein